MSRHGSHVRSTRFTVVSRRFPPCTTATSEQSLPYVSAIYCHMDTLSSALSSDIITGEVLAKIYRVSRANVPPSRDVREELHQRLTQWSAELPDRLNYGVKSGRPCPPPHVLALHIQYWATTLLMHRPLWVIFGSSKFSMSSLTGFAKASPRAQSMFAHSRMHYPSLTPSISMASLARGGPAALDQDTIAWQSFDICQSAANQIGSYGSGFHGMLLWPRR